MLQVEPLEDRLVCDTALASRFFHAGLLEFKNPSVTADYATMGRPPDAAGLAFWSAQTPLNAAIGILGSAEYDALHPGIGDKVFGFYKVGLGRAPDAAGWLYWTGAVLPTPKLTALPPPPPNVPGPSVNLVVIGQNSQGTDVVVVEGFDAGPTNNGQATWQITLDGITFTADDLARRSDKSFFDANVALGNFQGTYSEIRLS